MDNEKAYLLQKLIKQKNSKICLSLDIPEWLQFFRILEKVGNKIIMLKIHLDIMENLDKYNLQKLFNLKKNIIF